MREIIPIVLFSITTCSVFAQQGLLLSRYDGKTQSVNIFRIDITNWNQLQSDKYAFGASFTCAPYFSKSKSEIRVKLGGFLSTDKLNNASDITHYLIVPASPSFEMAAGYSKLFPQKESPTYFELAFNADFYYTARFLSVRQTPYSSDGHYKLRLSSYHLRSGFEIIPIPKFLSFYVNANFLLGISGKDKYQMTTENDPSLPEKAEYIDAGVKLMISVCQYFKIAPDINLIFAEKRIRDRISGGDSVMPTLKLNVTIPLP